MKVRVTIEADIELDYGETPDECAAALRAEPMHIAETLMPGQYVVRAEPIPAVPVLVGDDSKVRTSELAQRAAQYVKGRIDVV